MAKLRNQKDGVLRWKVRGEYLVVGSGGDHLELYPGNHSIASRGDNRRTTAKCVDKDSLIKRVDGKEAGGGKQGAGKVDIVTGQLGFTGKVRIGKWDDYSNQIWLTYCVYFYVQSNYLSSYNPSHETGGNLYIAGHNQVGAYWWK